MPTPSGRGLLGIGLEFFAYVALGAISDLV
jgi:hypothetical protein